jgi:hypothetical protein
MIGDALVLTLIMRPIFPKSSLKQTFSSLKVAIQIAVYLYASSLAVFKVFLGGF